MDVAIKLPLATICDLLGLAADAWSKMFDITEIVTDEELALAHPGVNIRELRVQRNAEYRRYLAAVVEGGRAVPRDDPARAAVGGGVDGCPLTPQQLNGNLVLLLGAGNETTGNATTRGVTALRQHRGAAGSPRRRPSRLEPAVEEILR